MKSLNSKTLILLVGPSASGKTTILNELVTQGQQSIVSTTTRLARPGEVNGKDYIFIDDYQSKQIEDNNGFVELVEYGGVRYGVTLEEFFSKLEAGNGVATLIVEPTGLPRYFKFCEKYGVAVVTMFVKTNNVIRYQRLRELAKEFITPEEEYVYSEAGINRIIRSAVFENNWENKHQWDFILDGNVDPKQSVQKIKNIMENLQLSRQNSLNILEVIEII